MPKVELHLHLDGSLQAARMLGLAEKNGISLPYTTVEEVEIAYDFNNLQSFLDLYYMGASVLREEEDFYHLMWDYLLKCREQNIIHTEIMIEPQTYLPNGVSLDVMMSGINRAIDDAENAWGQSVLLILDFLRHLPESDCLQLLEQVQPYRKDFVAIGLASTEIGNPPENFVRLYRRAAELGYHLTSHAGEEGPPGYVSDTLKLLNVERIDHGVRSEEDPVLMQDLINRKIPLTVCPLSNIRLKVFDDMRQHNILRMLEAGVKVTVNSDDPAYFGGFLNENYQALHEALAMTPLQAMQMNHNALDASFLPAETKQALREKLESYPVLQVE